MGAEQREWSLIRRHLTALRVGLVAIDALTALALFVGISLIRFGPGWVGVWVRAGVDPFGLAALWALGWISVLWLMDFYRIRWRWSVRGEVRDVLQAATLLAVAMFSALFVFKLPDVSRLFLLILFVTQATVTLLIRLGTRVALARIRDEGRNRSFMLVVGTGSTARAFADRVERHRELGLGVIGHLAVGESAVTAVGRRPVLGTVDDIEDVLHGQVVDEVAICLGAADAALIEPITRLCEEEGKIVRIPIGDLGLTLPGGRVEEFDGIPVLSLVYGPDRAVSLVVKRVLDIVLSAVALVVLAPIFLLLAIWIIALDGRPVLFRQTRVGLHGRPFTVVKFRTMVPDAEALLADLADQNEIKGHAFKLNDDPRQSRTGRILRATSVDELPQLWNVLRGEMSLVGPRPPLPTEVERYDVWHRRRLSMKPGITGLWQVEARREEDFDRWVELDLAYIDRWSVWLDLKIMLRTIPAMLEGR
jgi:exopolysaccharide biosynthesis polyprenyl glycosylphosphotransferase